MLYQAAKIEKAKVSACNGNTLAYIGDTVYQIMVQEYLLSTHDTTAARLHRLATGYVNHTFQSDAMERILPQLSEQEHRIYNRGRNSPKPCGKRSDPARHSRATGFEALIGHLYLMQEFDRLNQIFTLAVASPEVLEAQEEAKGF